MPKLNMKEVGICGPSVMVLAFILNLSNVNLPSTEGMEGACFHWLHDCITVWFTITHIVRSRVLNTFLIHCSVMSSYLWESHKCRLESISFGTHLIGPFHHHSETSCLLLPHLRYRQAGFLPICKW